MYDRIAPDIVTQSDVYPVVVMGSITPIVYVIVLEVGGEDTNFIDSVCRGVATGDKPLQAFKLDPITAHIHHAAGFDRNPQRLAIYFISRPNIQLRWSVHHE